VYDFSATDINDKTVDFSDFKGRVRIPYVLNIYKVKVIRNWL